MCANRVHRKSSQKESIEFINLSFYPTFDADENTECDNQQGSLAISSDQ